MLPSLAQPTAGGAGAPVAATPAASGCFLIMSSGLSTMQVEPVLPMAAEFAAPMWRFGQQ